MAETCPMQTTIAMARIITGNVDRGKKETIEILLVFPYLDCCRDYKKPCRKFIPRRRRNLFSLNVPELLLVSSLMNPGLTLRKSHRV